MQAAAPSEDLPFMPSQEHAVLLACRCSEAEAQVTRMQAAAPSQDLLSQHQQELQDR